MGKVEKGGVSLIFLQPSHPPWRLGTCSKRFPVLAGGRRGAALGLTRFQNDSSRFPLRAESVATEQPGAFTTPPTF